MAVLGLGVGEGDGGSGGPRRPQGGGGGGGAADNSRHNPFASLLRGVQLRLAADPEFLYKLAVECVLDAAIITAVNAAARGDRFFAELEFVGCQCAVSLLCDFALVYLLAPVAGASAAAPGSLAARLAALPAHVMQASPRGGRGYSLGQRGACLAVRGVQYGCVGLVMGCAGTGLVQALTALRERMDPLFVPPRTQQSALGTGLGWLYFMSTSSNLRYNLVNATEELLYSRHRHLARGGSIALRLANNFVGAHSWVRLAERLGLERPRPAGA